MKQSVRTINQANYPLRRKIAGFGSPIILLTILIVVSVPVLLLFGAQSAIVAGLAAAVLAELALMFVMLSFCFPKNEWRNALGLAKPKMKHVVLAVGIGLLLFLGLQLTGSLINMIDGVNIESSETSKSLAQVTGPMRFVLLGVFIPFLIPLAEELTFRGAVLGTLLNSGMKRAILVSAVFSGVFFGSMHIQGFDLASLFLPTWISFVGIVAAWLRIRFGSVFVPFAMHAAYNLVTVIAMLATAIS